jgi:hypothetical protein
MELGWKVDRSRSSDVATASKSSKVTLSKCTHAGKVKLRPDQPAARFALARRDVYG